MSYEQNNAKKIQLWHARLPKCPEIRHRIRAFQPSVGPLSQMPQWYPAERIFWHETPWNGMKFAVHFAMRCMLTKLSAIVPVLGRCQRLY